MDLYRWVTTITGAVLLALLLLAVVACSMRDSGRSSRDAESYEDPRPPVDDDDAAYTEQWKRHSGGGQR